MYKIDTPYSRDKTIINLFEESVVRYSYNTAIYLEDRSVSYLEFHKNICQCAQYFKKCGISSNMIIGVELERSYEMMIAIFAILKLGATYLPIDPAYPDARKRVIFNESQIQFLIVSPQFGNTTKSHAVIPISYEIILSHSLDHIENCSLPHDLAYVIYTSGSTGSPKGVMIEHHSLVNRLEWMQNAFPLSESDILFQKTHCSFDVSIWEIFWWSLSGAGLVLLPPGKESNVILITRLIEKYKISVIHFVPSVLKIFLAYVGEKYDLFKVSSLRYVFSSGELLDSNITDHFYLIFNSDSCPKLINLYGPTEATIDVSYFVCERNKKYNEVPIGKPIQNTKFFILDKYLNILPVNTRGELYISGVGLSRGYLNNTELTEQFFLPNPHLTGSIMYKTGDIAKCDEFGNFIFIEREDDQVKLRGLRIELREIVTCLKQHFSVHDAIVLHIDRKSHQFLAAFVIPKGKKTDDVLLINFLKKLLPLYMIPDSFIFIDEFPVKTSGKLDKNSLINMLDAYTARQ